MTQHTQGEWELRPSGNRIMAACTEICRLADKEDPQEKIANARLIAAAPKLLEALKKCRKQFDYYVSLHSEKNPPDMDKAAVNQEFVELCEAAIAAATGAA